MNIPLSYYLIVSTFLFVAGLYVVIARKNLVAILIGIELILNASALTFISYARYVTHQLEGHLFVLFIIVVAAAEATVGLAIVIRYYQNKETVHIDDAVELLN